MTSILLVDDEAGVREEFGAYLSGKGYRVLTAKDGLDGLRLFKREQPDLALIDYHMPEINGLDLLRSLKKDSPHMPVIMMSAVADMKTAVQALQEEAFDFLRKPVDSQELLTCIGQALKRRREVMQPEEVQEEQRSSRYLGPVNHVELGREKEISGIYLYKALDEYSKKRLTSAFERLLQDRSLKSKIVLVFSNVNYINNVGLNYLIELCDRLKSRGHSVVLAHLTQPVHDYLKLLGYLDYFRVELNVRDAVLALAED